MASSGKRKTTFAKLAREQKVRERRLEKKARKEARKRGEEPDRDRITHIAEDGVPATEDR